MKTKVEYILQSECLDGRHGIREYIVWEWSKTKRQWVTTDHPDNDWTTKRRATRLMEKLQKG